jgi:hypothetical protein
MAKVKKAKQQVAKQEFHVGVSLCIIAKDAESAHDQVTDALGYWLESRAPRGVVDLHPAPKGYRGFVMKRTVLAK